MDLELKNKTALVTAGSSGLGYASALALAREGAEVAICSRSAERAREAAQRIEQETGSRVRSYQADVTSEADLEALIDSVETDFGTLHALVCNAGGPPPGGFGATTEAQWAQAFDLTLMSVVRTARLALPLLQKEGGAILALGSSSVKQPIPNLLLSNVFRPAVQALVKHMAIEYAPSGVRINMLSPGRILTARLDQLDAARAEREGKTPGEVRAASVSSIPLGRLGTPDEFGRVAAFLCSGAASYMTGSSVLVDGGMVRAL